MKFKLSKEYQSILAIVAGLVVWYFITKNIYLIYIALCIGLLSLISQFIAFKIHWLWMKLAWLLSLVIPKIVLFALFFIVLLPISLLSKCFGRKDPLHLKQPQLSTFTSHDRTYQKTDLENMW